MALFNEELIWLGHANSIDLQLYSSKSCVLDSTRMAAITEMRLALKSSTIIIVSTDSAAGFIQWGSTDFKVGEIRIAASASTVLIPGRFTATLVVYDPSHPTGLVWDNDIPIRVMADPLAT